MATQNINQLFIAKVRASEWSNNYYYKVIILLKKIPGLFHEQIVQIIWLLKYYKRPFKTIEDGVEFFLKSKLGNKKTMNYWAFKEENRIFKILLTYSEFKQLFRDQQKKLNKSAKKRLKKKDLIVVEFGVRRTTTKPAYFGDLPPVSYSVPTRLDPKLTKLIYKGKKSYFNPSKKIAGNKELLILEYIHKNCFCPTLNGDAKLVYNKKTIEGVYNSTA